MEALILAIMILQPGTDPQVASELARGTADAALVYDIPVTTMIALSYHESRFKSDAESNSRCCGVYQMKADSYGNRSCQWHKDNPRGSAYYSAALLNRCRYMCKKKLGKRCRKKHWLTCYNSPKVGLGPCTECRFGKAVLWVEERVKATLAFTRTMRQFMDGVWFFLEKARRLG